MLGRNSSSKKRTVHVEDGVSVTPVPLTMGESLTIQYEGLLVQSGAKEMYAHIGYGAHDNWSEVEDLKMETKNNTWTCQVLPMDDRINFCFHDGANHWDNNYGKNWSLTVHSGK